MSNERITSTATSNYSITPESSHYGTKARVKFSRSCLKQDKATYNHGTIVNIYIVYEISKNYNISSYPTLENCLPRAASLTKHADIDQYKYSGNGVRFDRKGDFSFGNGFGRSCIIFGVHMSSSVYVDSKKKGILILGKGPTQRLGGTLTTEILYSINFIKNNKKFLFQLPLQWSKQLFIC